MGATISFRKNKKNPWISRFFCLNFNLLPSSGRRRIFWPRSSYTSFSLSLLLYNMQMIAVWLIPQKGIACLPGALTHTHTERERDGAGQARHTQPFLVDIILFVVDLFTSLFGPVPKDLNSFIMVMYHPIFSSFSVSFFERDESLS
jgi:hypothetical protein